MDENGSARSRGTIPSTEMKSYVKCTQHHLEPWVLTHDKFHRSLELAPDPSGFVRYPSKIVARVLDQHIDGSVDYRRASEVELDSR